MKHNPAQEALHYYIRRLTNLSGRSATLRLLGLPSDRFLDIHRLDQLLGRPSFAIIEALLAGKEQIALLPQIDQGDSESNLLSWQLRKIARTENFLYQERGSRDLHLAWPFVEGQLMNGHLIRAPLLLFPLRLAKDAKHWYLRADKHIPPSFNMAFLMSYCWHHQLPLTAQVRAHFLAPELPAEPLPFLTSLYRCLEASPIELAFNSAQFEQRLHPFPKYRKADLEARTDTGKLKLFPQAVLGIFPRGSSTLIEDYMQWLSMESPPQLDELLPAHPPEPEKHHSAPEESSTPLPMDGSQEAALEAIRQGQSMVIQGPPGTGKSQLIANLICDYLSRDQRVLLVCQKRAALDVIQERLSDLGLSEQVLKVCDVRSDRKSIYQQLSTYIQGLAHLQPSWAEASLGQRLKWITAQLKQVSHRWASIRSALYDGSACGLSIKNLYLEANSEAPVLAERSLLLHFSATSLDELAQKYKRYAQYARRFSASHPWQGRLSFASHGIGHLSAIQQCLKKASTALTDFNTESARYFSKKVSIEDLRPLFETTETLAALELSARALEADSQIQWLKLPLPAERLQKAQELLEKSATQLPLLFSSPPWAQHLRTEVVDQLLDRLPQLLRLRKRPLSWFLYSCFAKKHALLSESCRTLAYSTDLSGLEQLATSLEKRKQMDQLYEQLAHLPQMEPLPERASSLEEWLKWIDRQAKGLHFISEYASTPLPMLGFRYEEQVAAQLQGLNMWRLSLSELARSMDPYLSPDQRALLSLDPAYLSALQKSIADDFEDLCAFDQLREGLSQPEKDLLTALYQQIGTWDLEPLWALCLNSWRLAWIEKIEEQHPELRQVCTETFEEEAQNMRQLQIEKEKISTEWLQLHLSQRAAAPFFSSPPPKRPPYSKLRRQLEKQRHIWPLRQLVSTFETDLGALAPCWLASPEAVSAIFPLKKCFDLVLFDEASQCFLENGLPAIYRSQQCVIVGDKHQLQPNDLYQVKWEEAYDEEKTSDPEDSLPKEVLSLLDWASFSLPQMTLRGHYRSQSPELIDFSNQHFYQGELSLIPSYDCIRNYKAAIHYHKVKGYWDHNRTNPIEASYVIQLLSTLFREHPSKEIGIITFNQAQQALLIQEIDKYRSQHPTLADTAWDRLFVKNIENVQGDEREIIIFSIGYAPQEGKEQIQHFFGSLSVEGGENRLNVAITRAREALYVVASIWPEALQVDHLSGKGPRLLKQYLEYARRVSQGHYQPRTPPSRVPPSTHRLRDRLLAQGHSSSFLRSDHLSFADLSYHTPELSPSLIYTDDDLYYGAPSAKAFHLHRPRLLQAKGWKPLDIYSRAYWLDPQLLDKKLKER